MFARGSAPPSGPTQEVLPSFLEGGRGSQRLIAQKLIAQLHSYTMNPNR